jgi:hypothetical protein
MNLAGSAPILSLATSAFGALPMFAGGHVFMNDRNDGPLDDSQLWHLDAPERDILKFFFNITDVTSENGPFTFMQADASARVIERTGYYRNNFAPSSAKHGRLEDSQVETDEADVFRMVGPAGTGAMLNTSRCLHQGARTKAGHRIILSIHFVRPQAARSLRGMEFLK